MGENKTRILDLPGTDGLDGLYLLGVNGSNEGFNIPASDLIDGAKAPVEEEINKVADKASEAASAASEAKAQAEETSKELQESVSDLEQKITDSGTATDEKIAAVEQKIEDGDTATEEKVSALSEEVGGKLAPRLFVNAQQLLGLGESEVKLASVIALVSQHAQASLLCQPGLVLTFLGESGWESWQYTAGDTSQKSFIATDSWKKFGGSATVGNSYNVTVDAPLETGYYTLEQAIKKAYENGYTFVGIQITFAIADKSWKTYQYVGGDSSWENYQITSNWLDLAGMSAGDEMFINVDHLCGPCQASLYYTLEYAIAAIKSLSKERGLSYEKSGLVITYKTGENSYETKQFKNEDVSNFGEASLWQDFGGGGGGSVETKDEAEADGKDAFSTGGAYKALPADLHIDTDTEGVVKLQMVNAEGEAIGNEAQFAVGTGSGGGDSSLIVSVIPETSPLYTKSGGTVTLNAAITVKQGTELTQGIIEKVELYDRDSKQLLETFQLNQASSADSDTFDFTFDLSKYFTQASSRKFQLIAYDDTEHSGSRNVNVTAVDVTISSEQTLNYTAATILTVGGATKTLPMYRFKNNASDKGILCTTEIYIGGEWRTLGTATISDTYSHSITVNPNSCAGYKLEHGAYRLRIHGEDVASGVTGNYLYTSIMVVDNDNATPIVATRWYADSVTAEVKQYESVTFDYAVYSPAQSSMTASVIETVDGESTEKQSTEANRSTTYSYTQRVVGVETDGSVTISLSVSALGTTSVPADFKVAGTLLNIESVSAQLMFDLDTSSRSNSDADKTLSDNGYTLSLEGANYTTNGFVKDTYGTSEYGQEGDTGIMALRIAENVKGSLNYAPFNVSAIETNGLAIQFRIRTKHVADDEARLISCIAGGVGFYVTGKKVVFTTDGATTVSHTISAALKDDSLTDVALVIEPTSQAPYSGIGVVKMYFDGELIGACYYEAGSLSRHNTPITFDGTEGDLYLYNIRAWETYYSFEQSFNNYLLKLSDSDSMITEYDYNQVMASQSAEGKPATNRPQASALYNLGIPYFVLCKNKDTDNTTDQYPDYLETLNGDKKTPRTYDVYAYFPNRPWQDFKAIGVPTTNQGTTSSWRPIKNIKMKLSKANSVELIRSRDEFSGEQLALYDACAANAAKKKVQILDTSTPTNIITVKVDYSESGGANNGASTQLFNELQRALGKNYMTPAQNAYTGAYVLNTSIDSVPCAFFRTDASSADATSPSYGYFHAKGNWNADKGDAAIYGFENCQGYNADCLNYGDFTELIAARDQSLSDFESSIDKTEWDTSAVYVLSEFCGPDHKVFRYQDEKWTDTTGTMIYTGGRWRITGDVVNPVENYELKIYNGMDWFQGVKSVDDMLADGGNGKPAWLTYFESRYPDDDTLNAAYEDGRKVPYRLFKWLEWCEQCNQNLTESDGTITVDGSYYAGTKANRLLKFKRELHNVANVYSMICYHVFTDYVAAVDQRSKNMMLGFYLDTDGVTRAYLNHLYDGDTILGSDNDCGLTIPAELDPNNDTAGFYQGHDSVLFTQLAAADYIWLTDYTADSDTNDTTKTVTVASIAATMRSVQLASGLRPFSPQGIEKYWITDRLQLWPKLVSSYDGIRKYLERSTASENYFYALHGLSIQRLRDFVETRFLYRDGFYRCGDMYSSALQMRCTGTEMSVTIKAAKDGFFGIGVDQTTSTRESVYLKAEETVTLHSGNTNLGSGVMLYIYGANRIAELDLRNATPKQSGFEISELTLIRKLIIGGEDYTPATTNGDEMSTLNLGQLPFLEELDVRNFPISSIDATYCPRLSSLLADGSKLQSVSLAQTSPMSTLSLPDTMTALLFVNLPNLKYPNGGLSIQGFSKLTRLQLKGCTNIEAFTLLEAALDGGAAIKEIYVDGIDVTGDEKLLAKLMDAGVKGIGSDTESGCDGLIGRWIMSTIVDEDKLAAYQKYFMPEDKGLEIHNAQFTIVCFDDTMADPANITNLENGTSGDGYTPSGHISRIKENLITAKGKLNTETGVWEGVRLSDRNYQQLYDGSDFDYKDTAGESFDVMRRCPNFWYKGINDFKNQKKYICWSSLEEEPISTANKITRKTLSDILYATGKALKVDNVVLGESTLESDGILATASEYNVYAFDVEGMKQVRYPGVNHNLIGGVFLNAQGVIIGTFNMAVSNTLFDFVIGDYIFTDVPDGAVKFVFASSYTNESLEAIAVDSTHIEAIEPDWVHNEEWLGGVYEASVDGLTQLRSVSNAYVKVGTGTAKTSDGWTYDSNGRPKDTLLSTMNYTYKDFQNLAMMRGEGYQLFDYEMGKQMANLWYSLTGTRDAQLACGYGKSPGGTTGYTDSLGNADSRRETIGNSAGNKCLGFESFFGCTYEWMDNIAVNVPSYQQFLNDHGVATNSYVCDAKYHIFDPLTKTERVVQAPSSLGACIVRVKHGRYCDTIASKVYDDSSYVTHYCDYAGYAASTGRVVCRASSSARAVGGLAYAGANGASSDSASGVGARLAFRGKIEIS